MKYTSEILQRNVTIEAYIPLSVKAKTAVSYADYLIFRHGSYSLLELVFDEKDHMVYRINMPICKELQKFDKAYRLPGEYIKGDMLILSSNDVLTDVFICELYTDAIRVKLSDSKVSQTIVSDILVWELDENGELISVTVYGQPAEVIQHTYEELV